jgi:hypothetical protein
MAFAIHKGVSICFHGGVLRFDCIAGYTQYLVHGSWNLYLKALLSRQR